MPELPEVESLVRDLRAAGLPGARIRRLRVYAPRLLAASPELARRRLRGRRILAVSRRAKYILLTLSGGWTLLVHLRMTGQFRLVRRGAPRDPHDHLVLELTDGRELRFHDPRRFGRWRLERDPRDALRGLGPEPLAPDFTAAALGRRLAGRRGRLKSLLLNQAVMAGLGNIYADESLWRAGLHPCRRAHRLAAAEVRRLHRAIRAVLREAVRHGGTSLGLGEGNYARLGRRGGYQRRLRVYQRAGLPCPRCRTPVRRMVVGQRGTHFCPRCQRRARSGRDAIPLARRGARR